MMNIDRTGEPTGLPRPDYAITETPPTNAANTHEDPILDLLGSHLDDHGQKFDVAAGQHISPQVTSIDGNRLLGTLYAHYCKALDTPQSLMSGTWVPSTLGIPASATTHDHHEPWDIAASGAISSLFPDIERVDQAFGRLNIGDVMDIGEDEAIPEILRLFAPPEYKAKLPGEATRPPTLTQREHHTLAIDSPLIELNGAAPKN